MAVFEIRNLNKTYKNGAIIANKDINLTIKEGEIFGLLGPNGAGKTTLLKQMVGLLKPDTGTVKFYDQEVSKNPDIITHFVGHMTQRIGALGDLRVQEALEVTGKLKGMTKKTARQQAKDLIEEFDIKYSKRPLNKLSGGQNRLVSLCTALIGNPRVLILDEPTNDLDPVYRRQVWDKILNLNKTVGLTIILVLIMYLRQRKYWKELD
ncbi:MAG: ABC transporter ATP-binding protein [Halanaerobiales bacterium]|nr:ABC transporter ATP-binding protein [Halanaerobiales bacterium]